MKIVLLGTGDAFSSEGRASMAILLDGTYKILLDCSPQVIYSLRRMGYAPNQIQYAFITHLHGDHAGGIPLLALNLMHREKGKIVVSGPEGLGEFADTVYSTFYGIGSVNDVLEIRSLSRDYPFKFDYIEGRHPKKDYIYKIEMDGKKIVYTGDTSKMDLSEFANRADFLFHEAAELDDERADKYGHTTPEQAAEVARDADVKNLVFVHRPAIDQETIMRARKIFPNILLPTDLDILE